MKRENKVIGVCIILQCYLVPTMASIKVPYIDNMLLGRTFDYSKSIVGNDIFTAADRKKANTTKQDSSNIESSFKMISGSQDAMDVLDVSGQLSLQVMAGVVDLQGKGSYLKSSIKSEEKVEVLAHMYAKTKVETITDNTTPIRDWDKRKITGQHYIRSVTYGGYLVASMKFSAKKTKSIEDINASVKLTVDKAKKAEFGLSALFSKLVSDTQDLSSLEISYTSSIIPEVVPVDNVTLLKAIRDFPGKLKTQNGGNGVPITVELRDLGNLKQNSNDLFTLNAHIQAKTETLAQNYLGLRTVTDMIAKSIENAKLTDEMVEAYGKFNARMWNKSEIFFAAIDNLDLNNDTGKADQFDAAEAAFGKDELALIYVKKFRLLQEQYPLVEVDDYGKIPSNLVEIGDDLKDKEKRLDSLRKLHSGKQVAFSFQRASANDYLIAAGDGSNMTMIMACFSAKTNAPRRRQIFLSYSKADGGHFHIGSIQGKLSVKMRKTVSTFQNIDVSDNAWHAWCISWDTSGHVKVYKDGAKVASKTSVQAGSDFRADGIWVVGQDQDTAGKGFDSRKAFRGEIANVNIFETSDDAFGIQATASKCLEPDKYNDVVRSWREFKLGKMGEVAVIDNPECQSSLSV